jgi:hypothetical protein
MDEPVLIPVEPLAVGGRQRGTGSQQAAVNIGVDPGNVLEPMRNQLLVLGRHDRVKGVRMGEVEHRRLSPAVRNWLIVYT